MKFKILITSRYGENGEKDFKLNLPLYFDDLRAATSSTTIILWFTALPISAEPNAAVFDDKCIIFFLIFIKNKTKKKETKCVFHFYFKFKIDQKINIGEHNFFILMHSLLN